MSTDRSWTVRCVYIERDTNKTKLLINRILLQLPHCWCAGQPSWIVRLGLVTFVQPFKVVKSNFRGHSSEKSNWELGNSKLWVKLECTDSSSMQLNLKPQIVGFSHASSFGVERILLTSIGRTAMNFGSDIHIAQRINPNGDPRSFSLLPPAGGPLWLCIKLSWQLQKNYRHSCSPQDEL